MKMHDLSGTENWTWICKELNKAWILQSPPYTAIFHELTATFLWRWAGPPAKLSAHLGVSQATGCCRGGLLGKHTADCHSLWWQDISSSGLATKTLIFFILRTNNATKWQINQTTVDSNVHFTVDAIMYMYVNNLKCEVERKTCNPVQRVTYGPCFHAAQACSDEIWQSAQCHRVKVWKTCQFKLTNKRPTDTCGDFIYWQSID